MSAKKKAKPKNTIDMEKLAEEVRTKIRKKVDKEKPANKEVSTSKELPQRACIDCHFLVTISLFDCKLPTDIGVSDFNHYIYSNMLTISRELVFDNRELIQFRGGFSNTSLLGCWNKCWVEYDRCKTRQTQRKLESQHTAYLFKYQRPYDRQKVQELRKEVVEIDRSYCYLFYPYTEGMSFDAAKEIQGSVRLLRAGQIRAQSDQTRPLATQQSRDYEFFLKGEFWTISYEGKTTHLRDSRGLQYIHCLLENPEEEFYTLELVHKIKISPPFKNIYEFLSKEERVKQLIKESVYKGLTKNTGYVLDKKGIQSLKERYEDLESELEDEQTPPNDERTSEIEMDMDEIKKKLSAGRDKLGRPRKFPNEAEKARKAISKAVKESLDKIKDENNGHRSLWKHFEITLTIGIFCSYKPEKPIPWHL